MNKLNDNTARELLGITTKSSLYLNQAQLAACTAMGNIAGELEITQGQLYVKEIELACAFYNIVTDGGKVEPDFNVWTQSRKLVTKLCVDAHGLSEDRVRHIIGKAIKLLAEGVLDCSLDSATAGEVLVATKPAKATPDAVRMSAKRAALVEKFEGKSDSDLMAEAQELGNTGNYAEAGEFAKELESRQKAQAKATAKAERSGRTELNKEVRGGLKDASTELAAYMAWLVKHEESQAEFIAQQINAWKEHTS